MQELIFLKSLTILLSAAAFVVFVLHRARIPSLVGFLLAGMLLGPHGLHLIKDLHTIQIFAEIGVILLLFVIGLEFSLSRFLKMRLEVFGIGGLYVLITIVLTTLVLLPWLKDLNIAIFSGFLVALSSTAIVMQLLFERAELDSAQGRAIVGMLIFQDLCVVPFMLFIPIMAGGGGIIEVISALGKALAIIAIVLLSAKWLVPYMLHQIVRTRSRELFAMTILILCFGIAFLTSEFGLSLALGAFLAGLVISESEYAHEATSTILPFKDSFIGMFFISVGMLMDTSFLKTNLFAVLSLVGGIIFIKVLSGFFSMSLLRRPLRITIQTSLNLAQVGEFSFVLAVAGLSAGLISDDIYNGFLNASVLTMLLTPFFMRVSPFISGMLSSHHLMKRFKHIEEISGGPGTYPRKRSNHVLIIGFGLNGRNLARVFKEVEIPYTVLELNIDIVRDMKRDGEPIFYADGTKIEALQRLGLKSAKVLVVAISDPASCRNIVKMARRQNSKLFIIARTRYAAEVDDLLNLGADDVIPEEFETSLEITSRVLAQYQTPENVIHSLVDMIRGDGYRVLRHAGDARSLPLFDTSTAETGVDIEFFAIKDHSPVLCKSIEDLRFQKITGAAIVAIERDNRTHTSFSQKFCFEAGDVVHIRGKKEEINKAILYLTEGKI